jgi:hypothetical protein
MGPGKKSVLTLTGEWNGVMTAKWANGRSEVFVDTKAVPTVKKKVMPVSEQLDFESRRLWKDVTVALKLQDVSMATNAKFIIEQRQRELVKERQETGAKWESRVFHPLGDHWNFNNPLTQRQSKRTY